MDTFFIVISCVFVVLLIAALVLWFIDSRMAYKRKKVVAQKIESGRGLRVESEDLYLKVSNGSVEICDELPAPAEAAPAAAAAEEEEAPPRRAHGRRTRRRRGVCRVHRREGRTARRTRQPLWRNHRQQRRVRVE